MGGKTVASKWFGKGEKERRKAILWEEEEKKRLAQPIPTVSLTLSAWATEHLNDVQRRCSSKTYQEKRATFKRLAAFAGNCELTSFTPSFARAFLERRHDSQSGYAANKDRKNLSRAWEWGRKLMDGFPSIANPFHAIDRFKEERSPRYVPPVEDFDKVLTLTQGQDRVMLTAFINLAARKGEIFRLKWSDVDFQERTVRLVTSKTRDGSERADFIPMSEELRRSLMEWWQQRPVRSDYVFTMLDGAYAAKHSPGDPFLARSHFMKKICTRAYVKPFDFHSIRHLSAIMLYKAGEPVSRIQKILRHQNATTTNRYLASLGFEIEEMRSAVEALSRGPAKVIPLPKKAEAL
jgi:integrase